MNLQSTLNGKYKLTQTKKYALFIYCKLLIIRNISIFAHFVNDEFTYWRISIPLTIWKWLLNTSLWKKVLSCMLYKSLLHLRFKAILQVLIYKALYDKSYLGSKTTMTSGEWTCLISFATSPLTCSERGGSEKFKMKIYVSSGNRTHALPVHDRKVAAP